MRAYTQSAALFDRAAKVTPGGAQTSSKSPGRVGPVGAFPLYLKTGLGAHVWDVDDNTYIDWFNGNCAVTLGHADPHVSSAALRAMRNGVLLSLPHPVECEVAERLVAQIPCAEQVRFLKTGSEATEAAIRIARMATGRSVIMMDPTSYHGWHSWSVSLKVYAPGVPESFRQSVRPLRVTEHGFDAIDRDVAAVIVEPDRVPAHLLPALVGAAHQSGALLIFDEMITGNRWHVGGYQAYAGVTPDLATFGKAYANGFPLAFVCGPADLMRHAWVVSGTFGGDVVSLAACRAVLDAYQRTPAIETIWAVGQGLVDSFNGAAMRVGAPVSMAGPACRPQATWTSTGSASVELMTALFQQELAEHGVLAHPSGWNPSAAHDHTVLRVTQDVVAKALGAVAAYLQSPDPSVHLRGGLLLPAVRPS